MTKYLPVHSALVLCLGAFLTACVGEVRGLDFEREFSAGDVTSTPVPVRINSGGPNFTGGSESWSADVSFSGGSTYTTSKVVSGTSLGSLYQSERYGGSFSYAIPLVNGAYTLKLHFAEIYWTAPGKRVFSVSAEGNTIITNFDIYAAAGEANKAIIKTIEVTVTDGVLNLGFTASVDNAKISAIELLSSATQTSVSRLVSGSPAVVDSTTGAWGPDQFYTGGKSYATTNLIANTSDPAIFQSERYGSSFSYDIPVPNGDYTLKLNFSENYFTSPGKRKFNVKAQNSQVLTNYDIFAEAGGAFKAISKSFSVTVATGLLSLNFTGVVENAKVSSIEVLSRSSSAGGGAGGGPTPSSCNPDGYAPNPQGLSPSSYNDCGDATHFSSRVDPYPIMATSQSKTSDQIYRSTLNLAFPTEEPKDAATRRQVVELYRSQGYDVSIDNETAEAQFTSPTLLSIAPKHWSLATPLPLSGQFVQPYSNDSPFYHKLCKGSGCVGVPTPVGYFQNCQLNAAYGWDGIGIGIAVSSASDPVRKLVSQFYDVASTRKEYQDNIRPDAIKFAPSNTGADYHLSFINSTNKTVMNTYKIGQDPNGVDYKALYSAGPYPLGNLGNGGGSVAGGMSDLAALLRTGESIDPNKPIPHALFGPVNRMMKARIFPGDSMDAFVAQNSAYIPCQGPGNANTGVIPYGGVLQLDQAITFTKLPPGGTFQYRSVVGGQTIDISLPAFRMLEAMQDYGYYVADYGCSDMDIYTGVDGYEWNDYRGPYWVQQELESVIKLAKFYVVPPPLKRSDIVK
jgi:Malectin domain